MSRRRSLTVALAACAIALSLTTPASADDEDEARAAMRRGVAAFARGEADKALEEYETAKRLVPQANAPYLYAAEALVALGRYQEAVANLDRYLAKNPGVSDADDVRGRIAKIKADHYAGRVRINVNADDATVLVDGEDRGVVRTLEAKPGHHRLELRASGREPVVQEVEVVGDRDTSVVVSLPLLRTAEPSLPAPVTSTERPTPWPAVGWVTVGVGATTFLVALVVDAAALGPAITDYRDAASRGDPSARALLDDATSLRTLSVAGYVAGAVLAAGGLGVVLFAPRSSKVAPSSSALVTPFGVRGSF